MASSRIFVQGLPPSLTEDDFRKHFSQKYHVTDIKLLPHRRIGYVGFKSADDAVGAVKYFNRSFIRMSKILVKLADNNLPKSYTTRDNSSHTPNPLKRKLSEVQKPSIDSRPRNDIHEGENGTSASEENVSPESVSKEDSDQDLEDSHKSDADWMRSRTSRLLGLVDDDELDQARGVHHTPPAEPSGDSTDKQGQNETTNGHAASSSDSPHTGEHATEQNAGDVEAVRASGRLFLRNLPYSTTEDDLAERFSEFGTLREVHIPIDTKSAVPKGFGFIQFVDPEQAVESFRALDGTVFQGRLLHILPGTAKKEDKLDEVAISKLPLKKQKQIQMKADAHSTTFNWNSMYMNADAVMSSISDRLGIPKSELLDPSSSDTAVKQAQAETHVIQETKIYFQNNGVDLDAFQNRERDENIILVKNFSYGTKAEDLRNLFAQHGTVQKILMPPSGTIGIVVFGHATHAKAAFSALAYRKLGDKVLFLEKAPKGLFNAGLAGSVSAVNSTPSKPSTSELMQPDRSDDHISTTTLFVRNLNFSTTAERFQETFKPLDGFVSARVKTKPDPKKPGEVLSMGFGFLEFSTNAQASAAMAAMNGYNLDGHNLLIKKSHKAHDAIEQRRKNEKAEKKQRAISKIVIKNLPFEASKKDVRNLLRSYGQLRTVRVPKKFDNSRKGFAFAEFTTPREAESAMDALRDTHLLGRRLVLEFAAGESDDPEKEIEKMQQKTGTQSNNLALSRLVSGSERKKFRVGDADDVGDG